jgi:Uma2 family endonuclease
VKKPTQTEQPVLIPQVSWQKFETLLAELGQGRTVRLTYHRNKLEMLTPLPERDRCTKLIESLILVLADELDLTVESCSPLLLLAGDRGCAIEVDAGYYSHSFLATENHIADVTQDTLPDLAVEIVLTKSAFDKLALYADLGIAEVWRYVTQSGDDVLKGDLQIYQLQGNDYVECNNSALFPALPATQVTQFIQQSDTIGLVQALKLLRAWVQDIR